MIQILLLILKIIGIALLVVLGLILLILALVLFAPICYRVRLIWQPEHKEVKGRVSFLFPLFIVSFGWLEKLWYRIRAFGFVLLDSNKPKAEKPKEEKVKKEKPKKEKAKQERPEQEKTPKQEAAKKEIAKQEAGRKKATKQEAAEELSKEPKDEKAKLGFFERLRLKWEKLRDTIGNILKKIQQLLRQKEALTELLEKPRTKRVFAFVWQKCKRLLKHILPRKIKGYVKYGSSDPATTGQVMGIISVIYAKTGMLVDIVPNFEEEQLECDLEFRGRIQIFALLLIALKVLMNEEIKQVIQEFKNIKEIE